MPPFPIYPDEVINDSEFKEGIERVQKGLEKQTNAFNRVQNNNMIEAIIKKLESLRFNNQFFLGNTILINDSWMTQRISLVPAEMDCIVELLKKHRENND